MLVTEVEVGFDRDELAWREKTQVLVTLSIWNLAQSLDQGLARSVLFNYVIYISKFVQLAFNRPCPKVNVTK